MVVQFDISVALYEKEILLENDWDEPMSDMASASNTTQLCTATLSVRGSTKFTGSEIHQLISDSRYESKFVRTAFWIHPKSKDICDALDKDPDDIIVRPDDNSFTLTKVDEEAIRKAVQSTESPFETLIEYIYIGSDSILEGVGTNTRDILLEEYEADNISASPSED